MKVELEGKGAVALTEKNYLAQGGEGTLYVLGNVVVKIYADPKKCDRAKLDALKKLKHAFVAAPVGTATNSRGDLVGCFMPLVTGDALSLVFTNEYRNKKGFGTKEASVLVDGMREVVVFVHGNKFLLVDPNELNWLVEVTEPRIVDVDGWVMEGHVPSTVAKMPSIRDWHGPNVSRESDWFAWAVVTFQVYTGIHPYKGTLAGYKPSETERRMKDNASVFSPGVLLNRNVRDFSCIPAKLHDWYQGVFQAGDRSVPPSPFEVSVLAKRITVLRTVVTATDKVKYEKIRDKVLKLFSCGVVLTSELSLVQLASGATLCQASRKADVVRVEGGYLIADWSGSTPDIRFVSPYQKVMLFCPMTGKQFVTAENRLFMVTQQGLMEIEFRNLGRPLVSAGKTWGAMYNSTRWWAGIGVQDAFGATWAIMPFGKDACAQIRLKELDGLTVVSACRGERFAAFVALSKSGEYRKLEFSFDESYSTYTVWQGTADSPELNLAALPKGVCATIVQDGELVIFVPGGKVNKITDKGVSSDMMLCNRDNLVYYIKDEELWRIGLT